MTLLLLFSGADFAAAPVTPDAAGYIYAEIESIYMIHTDIEPIDSLTEGGETYQIYSED